MVTKWTKMEDDSAYEEDLAQSVEESKGSSEDDLVDVKNVADPTDTGRTKDDKRSYRYVDDNCEKDELSLLYKSLESLLNS
mmetsp:Transcript_15444/g.27451  ORF Transcript_15444/g.27451 Transcript_15444/m.27451 type:complete len:81 (+) Transcript_15444:46-288(+)